MWLLLMLACQLGLRLAAGSLSCREGGLQGHLSCSLASCGSYSPFCPWTFCDLKAMGQLALSSSATAVKCCESLVQNLKDVGDYTSHWIGASGWGV